jgi:cytochrome c oxidase cbb3-type subunit 1
MTTMNLYFLMTILFVAMAFIAAVDASLTSYTILPWFNGLRWLRVHLITLGAVTESLFGLLPLLVASRSKLPRPRFRWAVWLPLNAGLLTLLVGIPIVNQALILTGGTLVFIATTLLIDQLRQMRSAAPRSATPGDGPHDGRRFYVAGMSYLLLGIIVGTGLWLGWSEQLQIQTPVEVHIHANNWGFLSLVFAGLLVDLYPAWTNRPLAWPRSISPIFWMMTLGALGLVLGPWFKSNWFSVPGLLLHLSATVWLLLNVIKPLLGDRKAWSRPGIWHLVTAYFWILAPVLVAPLIILGVPGFPGAGIEQNAPQALIYGWVLQFSYAFLPYFFRRALTPGEMLRLGGHWFSLATVHLGGVFLWASIFITNYQGFLHGTAYALWALSIAPIALDLGRITRVYLSRVEEAHPATIGEMGTDLP